MPGLTALSLRRDRQPAPRQAACAANSKCLAPARHFELAGTECLPRGILNWLGRCRNSCKFVSEASKCHLICCFREFFFCVSRLFGEFFFSASFFSASFFSASFFSAIFQIISASLFPASCFSASFFSASFFSASFFPASFVFGEICFFGEFPPDPF